MSVLIEQVVEHWRFMSPLLRKPKTEADYDVLVEALDELLDIVGGARSSPVDGRGRYHR